MNSNNKSSVSFSNINFQVFKITAVIFIVAVLIMMLLPTKINWMGTGMGAGFYLLLVGPFLHPRQFVLTEDKLIYGYLFGNKKIINVKDIVTIDISKVKRLSFSYLPAGFTTPSIQNIRLKENDMKLFQEELLKRNPNIEIVYN